MQVFKHIPIGIIFRLSTIYSDINIFSQSKHNYKLALQNCDYKTKRIYKTTYEASSVRG